MSISVKTFRIFDKASEEELNQFIENKVVRHWSTNYTGLSAAPPSDGTTAQTPQGVWEVFIAFEPREERAPRTAPNDAPRGQYDRRDGRNDGRQDTRQPRSATSAQPRQREVREPRPERAPEHVVTLPESEMPLFEAVRKWRNARSREENVKPFTLFNNKQLEELVKAKPQTRDALRPLIPDMRNESFEKYGNELIGFMGGAMSESSTEQHAAE